MSAWNDFKNNWNNAWSKPNIGQTIGNIANGASGIISSTAALAQPNQEAINAAQSNIDDVLNSDYTATSYDSLMGGPNLVRENYSASEFRQPVGQQVMGILNAGLSGASMLPFKDGGKLNVVTKPMAKIINDENNKYWIGGAIAGGVGLLSGIGGAIAGNIKAKREAERLSEEAEEANIISASNYHNSATNVGDMMFNNAMRNFKAYGGDMNLTENFSNGITFINNGGTHEENPLGGVLVGFDQQGVPNLVEEGEIIYNDYVFSNRLKLNKKLLEDNGFNKKYEGYTFAELVKEIQEESAERPNDKISKDGLNDMLDRIIQMQEEVRMKKEKRQMNANIKAFGGLVNKYDNGTPKLYHSPHVITNETLKLRLNNDELKSLNSFIPTITTNQGVKINMPDNWLSEHKLPSPKVYTNAQEYVDSLNLSEEAKKEFDKQVYNNIIQRASNDRLTNDGFRDIIAPISKDSITITSAPNRNYANRKFNETIKDKEFNNNDYNNQSDNLPTFMRYAPMVGNLTSALWNAFAKPDYSNIDRVERKMMNAPKVASTPVSQYMEYNPVDRNYLLNPMLASSQSSLRAAQNSGLNAGQVGNQLLALNNSTQNAIGNTLFQSDAINDDRKLKALDFNRATDQYNSQSRFNADATNLQTYQQGANTLLQTSSLREQIAAGKYAAISNDLSNMFTSVGDVGKENFAFNNINELAKNGAINVIMNPDGTLTPVVSNKNGGYLTIKKRRNGK